MANPLDRTWFNTLIDDDGSGSTGTIWNKAQVDGLLDTVDASLAGVIDKAGGAPPPGALGYFIDGDTIQGGGGLIYQEVPGALTLVGASNYTAFQLTDNSQPANQRSFKIVNSNGGLQLQAVDDAGALQGGPWVTHTGALRTAHVEFPSTQTPSADPYTQDDYREVSWTPRFDATGGASGQTYSEQSGRAIKIGRKVTCIFQLTLSALGTMSGGLLVQDLPFPASTAFGNTAGGMMVYAFSPLTSSISYVSGYVTAGTQLATLTYLPAGGGAGIAGFPVTLLTSTTALWAEITYFAQN